MRATYWVVNWVVLRAGSLECRMVVKMAEQRVVHSAAWMGLMTAVTKASQKVELWENNWADLKVVCWVGCLAD